MMAKCRNLAWVGQPPLWIAFLGCGNDVPHAHAAWPKLIQNETHNEAAKMTLKRVSPELTQASRHCEEQSDEAIQVLFLDCFALRYGLAMTSKRACAAG
jgi:hypothetical protein